MTADLFVLRDFVERGFRTFDIAYRYTSGEVMEAEIPPTYQPLFGNQKSLKLCFSDAPLIDPSIERVTHGALVLDALGRLLEGNRNTIGHALIARKITFPESPPSYKDRLHVLNAKVSHTASTLVYRPIVRLEFRVRVIGSSGIRSQNVPVFYDLETGRVLEGSRYADLNLLDVEETHLSRENIGLKTPPGDALAGAADAAAGHLKRQLSGLEPSVEGDRPVVGLHLKRMLVLHDPRAGLLIRYKERSTQREFALSFSVGEDPTRIAAPFCRQCGRIKTHYYISHRTGQLICTDCSLLCVGCWDAYSLEGRNCDLCEKRRYCPHCLRECGTCGTLGCPDHTHQDSKTGRIYCVDCAPPVEDTPPEPRPAPGPPSSGPTRETPRVSHSESPTTDSPPPAPDTATARSIPRRLEVDDESRGAGEAVPPPLRAGGLARLSDTGPDGAGDGPAEGDPEIGADISAKVSIESDRETDSPSEAAPDPNSATMAFPDPDDNEDLFALDDDLALAPPSDGTTSEDDEDIFACSNGVDDPSYVHPTERGFDSVFLENTVPENRFPDPDHGSEPTGFDPEPDVEEAGDPVLVEDDPPDATPFTPESEVPAEESGRTVQCACHGQSYPVTELRIDFLSGRNYCPEQVQPCSRCGQATAVDFLDGDPPLCFYCQNRMPLNLDPEGEEIFRREVQPRLPIKYRLASCHIARSPHHLAYYIKPIVGREVILYWDRWTDALLDDDQF